MPTDRDNDRTLIVYPSYSDGQHGFFVCLQSGLNTLTKSTFLTDEVLSALAFGDEQLAEVISFKRLTEVFISQLNALANTEDWDKHKKQRHIEQITQLFAQGCASWFKVGQDSMKKLSPQSKSL